MEKPSSLRYAHQMNDGIGSRRLPKECDLFRIATECFDVGFDPFERRDLIVDCVIGGIDSRVMKKTESAQAKIDVDDDDVACLT